MSNTSLHFKQPVSQQIVYCPDIQSGYQLKTVIFTWPFYLFSKIYSQAHEVSWIVYVSGSVKNYLWDDIQEIHFDLLFLGWQKYVAILNQ